MNWKRLLLDNLLIFIGNSKRRVPQLASISLWSITRRVVSSGWHYDLWRLSPIRNLALIWYTSWHSLGDIIRSEMTIWIWRQKRYDYWEIPISWGNRLLTNPRIYSIPEQKGIARIFRKANSPSLLSTRCNIVLQRINWEGYCSTGRAVICR